MTQSPIVALDARLLFGKGTGDRSYWRGLLRGMTQWSFDGEILLCYNSSAGTFDPEALDPLPSFCRWFPIPAPLGGERAWSLFQFPRIARQQGARVFHTQYNLSPFVRNGGITTIHDVSFFIGPEWFSPKDRFLLRSQIPRSAERAKVILTVSETSKREIERYIPAARGKVVVTPNALGDEIRPVSREEARRKVATELNITSPFFFTLGTRWPRKNLRLAIEIMNHLSDLPHQLVITGKEGWGDLPENSRVIYTDFLTSDQVSWLYSAADLYLCPSLHEGFGIPLLEAFACSCPVVCGSGGALPEVAGDAALVLQSYEVETWAQAIRSLVSDSGKLEKMKELGAARLGAYSWGETARLTLEVYQDVFRQTSL
ncbi:MAG: glycosyltransferase family 4 protein [Fimbriimonadaceae bacterium]|nr:glycosyltransferase family 4 protein [Fimbriimonadaceae bacterium]